MAAHKKGPAPPGFRIQSPCMYCDRRHTACHDRCEDYAVYRKKIGLVKDAIFHDTVRQMKPTAHQKGKGNKR